MIFKKAESNPTSAADRLKELQSKIAEAEITRNNLQAEQAKIISDRETRFHLEGTGEKTLTDSERDRYRENLVDISSHIAETESLISGYRAAVPDLEAEVSSDSVTMITADLAELAKDIKDTWGQSYALFIRWHSSQVRLRELDAGYQTQVGNLNRNLPTGTPPPSICTSPLRGFRDFKRFLSGIRVEGDLLCRVGVMPLYILRGESSYDRSPGVAKTQPTFLDKAKGLMETVTRSDAPQPVDPFKDELKPEDMPHATRKQDSINGPLDDSLVWNLMGSK